MLTSYMVRCPHFGCNWFGSLLPRGEAQLWRGASPSASVIVFQCPQCQYEWRARIVGEDVEALPLEDTPLPWA